MLRIDSRGKADGAEILFVVKQELFGFAFLVQRSAHPFIYGAGNYSPPESLLWYFLDFIFSDCVFPHAFP